jgi:cyanophycin synthetase
VAALLNVQDDHIGADGIETLDQMAELKAQVLERATQAVVVNADDARCLAMLSRSTCDRRFLVSRDRFSPALQQHLGGGGEAVFVQVQGQQPWIVMARGAQQEPLMPLHDIPATLQGLLAFNEGNALFAVALAWSQGLAPAAIRNGLATFRNSPEQNPGRYNFVEGLPYEVLVDFAHNPDGVRGLFDVVRQRPVSGQRWLVNMMVGNRFKAHLEDMLGGARGLFDQFVLSGRLDVVSKSNDWACDDPMKHMLRHGQQCLSDQGVEAAAIRTFEQPEEAIRHALAHAQPGDQVVFLVRPWVALPIVQAWINDAALVCSAQ